jgi:hypothetical protein
MTFVLLAAIIWAGGCAAQQPMPTPDAIKGWKCHDARTDPPNYHSGFFPYYHVDQAIIDDYQAYARKVLKFPDFLITDVDFYEDGTGKHAVRIEADQVTNGRIDCYLIYDTNNVRIKVIKGTIWYPFHI